MEFFNLFATPVAIFEHPDYKSINEEILSYPELQNLSNDFRQNVFLKKDSIPVLSKLHNWLLKCTAEYAHTCFGIEYQTNYFEVVSGTINNRFNGSHVPFHNHRWSHITTTYYIQTPENCGNIRIIDPRTGLGWVSIDRKAHYNQFNHKPKEGQLIMFPSWVIHNVDENRSGNDRIALTSDLKLVDSFNLN